MKAFLKCPFAFTTSPFPFNLDDYPISHESWCKLASDVHQWLVKTSPETETDEWQWAVNFFWICYVGASPRFPVATNSDIEWNPDIVPISGEFINTCSMLMVLGKYITREHGVQLIARLVEWMQVREKWIIEGVDIEEYWQRIAAHEVQMKFPPGKVEGGA
ncbi:hypothetical protein Clacol_004446 [Clathrus columnatus]|uniref:Uncharacterized protein n=1 Tax=Clathrus columnatus TaxID=1419009 RepID=A0AAV5ABC3_9AGAM|nr:hypothetical protein Clacol_004446 [Clathrus columnatus]